MILGWFIPLLAIVTTAAVAIFSKKLHPFSSAMPAKAVVVLPYVRRFVYGVVLLWVAGVYMYAVYMFPTEAASWRLMTRVFGFSALALVYITLVPGLVRIYFPGFPFTPIFVHARRALGVSVFLFGVLHGALGFIFNLTGSINAFFFLALQHQLALLSSGIALFIFTLLTLTSTDYAVRLLGKRWKWLHRWVYVAAICTVFHAFLIGSHFVSGKSFIPVVVNFITLVFILLETGATWKRISSTNSTFVRKRLVAAGLIFISVAAIGISSWSVSLAYDPHSRHRQGYSKDYSVEMITAPAEIKPNSPLTLTFSITDKRTGKRVEKFRIIQEKLMHVIVLSKDLTYYDHIHPEYLGNGTFSVTTMLPKEGTYQLYIEYSPPDFFENVTIVSLKTNGAQSADDAHISVGAFDKHFASRYQVKLSPEGPFRKNESVDFIYTLSDDKTGKPLDTLEPYLGAFGHLAMVSEDGLTYVHVHPVDIPTIGQTVGGPSVRFNTYFPKAGKYKLFAQFQHEGKLFVTDFVVEAK